MKPLTIFSNLLIPSILALTATWATADEASCPDYLNAELRRLHSKETANLCSFFKSDKPILVVNTASNCGYTGQFGDLEKLYQKYKDQGLVILGFPSNSFNQEEKSEEATATVCFKNFGVTFPMFEHVDVKGKNAHPLFKYLAQKTEEPAWNFNKYLIDGGEITHFGSKEKPLESNLEKKISASLNHSHHSHHH
ncbi:glutathione peroxidase [Saccharophagus sp. K07]|uniref:glutathione peroxidase n=1 Tax=Saccharophagus sp. K07 TaxID=2283636 RepID=UPI0016523BB5|nr:glutathione peroxidase [Saccharophagus sp. K07]MBC6905869.1 glutathione peroxidase [Saccharophagus sp. K07]